MADIPHCVKIGKDEELFSSKVFIPITYVKLDTSRSNNAHSDSHHSENIQLPTKPGEVINPYNLVVGSAVQYHYHNFEHRGVIKWIGNLQGSEETFAGVEIVRQTYVLNCMRI